jgi:hypothetical protein
MSTTKKALQCAAVAYSSTILIFGIALGTDGIYRNGFRTGVRHAVGGALLGAMSPMWGPVWIWRGRPRRFDMKSEYLHVYFDIE